MSSSKMDEYDEIVRCLQSNLECSSCHLLYRSPKVSVRCSHVACFECFINLVCPLCQTPASESDLKDEKRLLQIISIFKSLPVNSAPKSNAENVPQASLSTARPNNSKLEPQAASRTPIPPSGQQSARNARASAAQSSAQKINKKNRLGETPLHVACKKRGNIDKVRELLAQGAEPNTQDNAGWSPLHEVAQTGDLEVAEALFASGASVNVKADCKTTPLHDAVTGGYLDIIKLFLEHGADINARGAEDKTPLQISSYNALVEDLLKTVKSKVVDAPPQKSVNLVIMSSSLKEPQAGKLSEFLKLMDAQQTAHFTPQVTHLVVNIDPKGDTQRTLKFLQCLASRKSIVSFQWVEQCLKARGFVSELPFEVKGCRQFSNQSAPKRAREAVAANQPGLLKGFNLYFPQSDKPSVPTTENLIQLTELAGGTVLKKHPKKLTPEEIPDVAFESPYLKTGSILKMHRNLVVGNNPEIISDILYVTRDWLIDSISNFELMEPVH